MSLVAIAATAIAAVTVMAVLKPKNGEIAVMLGASASVVILLSVLSNTAEVFSKLNEIIAGAGLQTNYVVILLKVIGICLVTEFASNTCRDAGSSSLASNVTLAGKLMVTVTALPLYSDILGVVKNLLSW